QGAGVLPRLRAPLPGLCAPEMPGLRGEAAGGFQLQGPGLFPVVYGRAGAGVRPRVLTFPFSWGRRLAQDGALLGRLTCIAVETVLAFSWEGLGHLGTSEVGEVLERLVRRMERYLRRSGQLRTLEDEAEADGEGDPEGNLAASAVYGQAPPGGPQWVSRLAPLEPQALAYDKPLCASLDGFTLHAATRPGATAPPGRGGALAS